MTAVLRRTSEATTKAETEGFRLLNNEKYHDLYAHQILRRANQEGDELGILHASGRVLLAKRINKRCGTEGLCVELGIFSAYSQC